MHRSSCLALTALALATSAGLAQNAEAQAGRNNNNKAQTTTERNRQAMRDQGRFTDYRSCAWLMDLEVVNPSNQEIADVDDLLVDRGSGRIESVIVKTGTTLGMGGRTVAIPYEQFSWDPANDRLVLASSAEQLKQYPEFSKSEWRNFGSDTAWNDDRAIQPRQSGLRDWARRNFGTNRGGEYYGSAWDTSMKQKIEGEVKSVDRDSTRHGDQVVVEIATTDGATRKVALGPSWYLSGGEAGINRGDKISVEIVPVSVATSARINGRDVALRGSGGTPVWSEGRLQAAGRTYAAPYYRHALLSDIRGAKLDCRGTDCGKVDDLIIERGSGTIAFLSIDPNENFLGIADTKRLVPWTVASIAMDGTVRIDANKQMILASPTTPSDTSTLSAADQSDMIFKAYEVSPRRYDQFRRDDDTTWQDSQPKRQHETDRQRNENPR